MTRNVEAEQRPQRWRWPLVAAIVSVAAVVCGAWALVTMLKPAEDPLSSASFTLVEVGPGTVESSLTLNTAAEWKAQPVGTNRASGVVTTVAVEPGTLVTQGTTLYTVDLRPVVIARGQIPAFRPIAAGTKGADVAQLQRMLRALGVYDGPADGRAGSSTVRAISSWQKSQGVDPTGSVDVGDVIFVPSLPARITLDQGAIGRGKAVSGGEPVVLGLPQAPIFTIPVTTAQAGMIPTGTRVQITSPKGGAWEGYAVAQSDDPETQNVVITLAGKDGAGICGHDCVDVPVAGPALLRSKIITVEPMTGLAVPSAALVTAPDGATSLIDAHGRNLPVVVRTSARGMSIVEGVDAGVRVRIPADGGGR